MKKLVAIATLLAAASTASAQVNFDRGVDIKSFSEQAASAEMAVPEARLGLPTYSSRDCKKVEFTAESPLTSADISLRSMTMYQDCQNFGAPVGQICASRPEYYSEITRVTVTAPRELKPGEKENFEVCLWGRFLTIRPVETVYKYKSKVTFEGVFITPQGLVAPKAGTPAADSQVLRYQRFRDTLSRLEREAASSHTRLNQLESEARRIIGTGQHAYAASFQMHLRDAVNGLRSRPGDYRNAGFELKALVASAGKDYDLNKLAFEIDRLARTLVDQERRVEFSADRLDSIIRSARPEVIGYYAAGAARDLRRAAEECESAVYPLVPHTTELFRKTRP